LEWGFAKKSVKYGEGVQWRERPGKPENRDRYRIWFKKKQENRTPGASLLAKAEAYSVPHTMVDFNDSREKLCYEKNTTNGLIRGQFRRR